MSFGGRVTPGQTGSLVWHMLQRDSTMSCASFDVDLRQCAGRGLARAERAESHATAIMPAAATPQVHHGLPLPSWREL